MKLSTKRQAFPSIIFRFLCCLLLLFSFFSFAEGKEDKVTLILNSDKPELCQRRNN